MARRVAVVPEHLADAVDPLDRRVLGGARRLPDPDHRRPAVARRAVARRAALAHRRLAAARARPLRRRHDAGALRPRHQPVLGHPLHAGRREDDRDRGAALADRLQRRRDRAGRRAALRRVPLGDPARRRERLRSERARRDLHGRGGGRRLLHHAAVRDPFWERAGLRDTGGRDLRAAGEARRRRAGRVADAAAQPADDRGSRAGPRRRRLSRVHGIVRRDCLRAPRHGAAR